MINIIMARNNEKNRKSRAQELYEEAENAGRFAGNDADAKAAREQAVKNISQEAGGSREDQNMEDRNSDAEARREPAQSHDYKGEAQNVNDDTGRTLNEEELKHGRNKANEGLRQNRDTSSSGTSDRTTTTDRPSEDIY
jgi:hypothetical protein